MSPRTVEASSNAASRIVIGRECISWRAPRPERLANAAATPTGIGILYLPVDNWVRAFLGMGLLFTVGSSFTLAKTLRDNHEASRLLRRLSEAKTEKVLREYELKSDAA